jgi:hypothetical protein
MSGTLCLLCTIVLSCSDGTGENPNLANANSVSDGESLLHTHDDFNDTSRIDESVSASISPQLLRTINVLIFNSTNLIDGSIAFSRIVAVPVNTPIEGGPSLGPIFKDCLGSGLQNLSLEYRLKDHEASVNSAHFRSILEFNYETSNCYQFAPGASSNGSVNSSLEAHIDIVVNDHYLNFEVSFLIEFNGEMRVSYKESYTDASPPKISDIEFRNYSIGVRSFRFSHETNAVDLQGSIDESRSTGLPDAYSNGIRKEYRSHGVCRGSVIIDGVDYPCDSFSHALLEALQWGQF